MPPPDDAPASATAPGPLRVSFDPGSSSSTTVVVTWRQFADTLASVAGTAATVASCLGTSWNVWGNALAEVDFAASPERRTEAQRQRAVFQAADQERRQAERERLERYRAERDAREARARETLGEFLSDAQRAQYEAHGYFDVVGASGRRYRLVSGEHVREMDGPEGDSERYRLCLHPVVRYPDADVLLTQKLLLETNELEFIMTANRSPSPPERRRPDPAPPPALSAVLHSLTHQEAPHAEGIAPR